MSLCLFKKRASLLDNLWSFTRQGCGRFKTGRLNALRKPSTPYQERADEDIGRNGTDEWGSGKVS
jgi:hypothetical protein